jgi:hypothetical protein
MPTGQAYFELLFLNYRLVNLSLQYIPKFFLYCYRSNYIAIFVQKASKIRIVCSLHVWYTQLSGNVQTTVPGW